MANNQYVLVDATELDSNLESIANALREKLGDDDSVKYSFPDDFIEAINQLTKI